VVIPTRDRIDLLKQTLSSVLGQRDVDLEVIVIDDGSTEDVGAALDAIGDGRVRLLRNDNSLGVSEARNRGIAEARAPWVACIDDDDLWAPSKLRRQLDAAGSSGRGWVYAGAVNVTRGLQVVAGRAPATPEEVMSRIRFVNLIPGGASGVLMRRDLALGLGGFDAGFRHFADWDLWMRLADDGPPASVPSPLVAYRVHPGNMAITAPGEVADDLRLFAKRGISVDRTAIYRWLGWWARRSGRTVTAIRYLVNAWRLRADGYSFAELASDISYIIREAAERLRLRYLRRLVRGSLIPRRPLGDLDWITEAEGWIVRIKASLPPE
jgi:glycosyltransferase involved in cell wall biosynthesis